MAHDPGAWPWATLAANLVAAGLLAHLTVRPPRRWWLLGPGLCGGLSTFSTVQLELLWMLDAGHVALAALYAAVSVAAGLAVVAAVRATRDAGVSVPVLIGLALLGGLGSVARVLVAEAAQARTRGAFPTGVLVVNLSGSLALGVLVGAGADGDALRLLGIGLLGGYTTFSAWMVDTDRLTRGQAVANVAISLAAGLAAVWLGRML